MPETTFSGMTHLPVVVIGAGQAGLSLSWHLKDRGVEHVVLERHRYAAQWRDARWDTFCLVTPNWQCRLPGFPYDGDDPDGFMVREEILDYFDRYVSSFDPPLREGVEVTRVRRVGSVMEVETSEGTLTADHVVVATGSYQRPVVPPWAPALAVPQLHSQEYRNPEQLPPGDVLVVGSGQSGAQIAEDLHLAGRQVHLCLGDAPRVARTYRGRDVVAWLEDLGYYRMTADERPDDAARNAVANHYVTGRDGGRDIDLRAFARDGMRLYGLLEGLVDGQLRFRPDLREALDRADRVSESIKDTIDKHIAERGIDAPWEDRYVPVWQPDVEPLSLDVSTLGSVVWAIGFRPDYSWIDVPVFTGRGAPAHHRGVTAEPGLLFLGLTWQWTWGSARFSGVGADAAHLADVLTQ